MSSAVVAPLPQQQLQEYKKNTLSPSLLAAALRSLSSSSYKKRRRRITLPKPTDETAAMIADAGLELDQTAATGSRNGFRAAEHVQLAENAAKVRLHRCFGDKKLVADFLVAFAVRQ